MKLLISVIIYSVLLQLTNGTAVNPAKVHYLENEESFYFTPGPYNSRELHIFCYQGRPKFIIHLWQSVLLKISHSTEDYNQYEASTPEEVDQEYKTKSYGWSINLFSTRLKNFKLNPFNTSCVGIESRDRYEVQLKVVHIDLWKVLTLALGSMLFLSAPTLSHNTLFHYLCGISFGICASFMILIYLISKLFPKKPLMYGVIGAGWTIVMYFLQMLWENMKLVLDAYKIYVLWYFLITGSISFIVCYRWGPVHNPRTLNLIKWSLQLVGLLAIYLSSHFHEAAIVQIAILLLIRYIPKSWVAGPKNYWQKRFPPKIKPLTNDEYYEQGVRETVKALEELREYCSSPQCNQWNTALKLTNVKRFASFIEGSSHLSDNEVLDYETSMQAELTDEEDEISDDESS